jgi:putative sugar O-methyltransferase
VATPRGVISYRAIQALYQAWRLFALVDRDPEARVVEIGAGLGRTAFYARQLGLRNYTIVDLPMSCVAQAYFLGRTLGDDAVSLLGEERSGISILPPSAFLDGEDTYDLVVNVDSLTELDPKVAKAYCKVIRERAGVLLSINHESNLFTVREMCNAIGMVSVGRTPYWMRAGYVEEVFLES